MPKPTIFQKITYWSDRLLRSSFAVQMVFLGFLTAFITLVGASLIIWLHEIHSWPEAVWWSFLEFISPDHLDAHFGRGVVKLINISMVLSGWVIFGLLISVLSTTMNERLEELRRGATQIIDRGHTVVLGWSSMIFSILDQLHSDDEGVRGSVVLLAERDKEEMEQQIAKYCLNRKAANKTIVRKGSIESVANLRRANIAYAREVIVLDDKSDDLGEVPDSRTLKSLLAIHQAVSTEADCQMHDPLVVIAGISTERTRRLLGDIWKDSKGRPVHTIFVETHEILGRMIAQCAVQPGLALVYRELLTYESDPESHNPGRSCEIYCVPIAEAGIPDGTPFSRCHFSMGESIPIGICRGDKTAILNPEDGDLRSGDFIVAVADHRSDVRWKPRFYPPVERRQDARIIEARSVLLLGKGKKAATVLREMPDYLPGGSAIFTNLEKPENFRQGRATITFISDEQNCDLLDDPHAYCLDQVDTVILTDDLLDRDQHDTRILARMMAIRAAAHRTGKMSTVIVELADPRNRELAEAVGIQDVILSTAMVSHYLVQLAREPERADVFRDLFDSEGMEIYLRLASLYNSGDTSSVSFDDLASGALARNEIAIGYLPPDKKTIVLCPIDRQQKKQLETYGLLVVVAEG